MTPLRLSCAIGNYDRNRALFDGDVRIDGVEPIFMRLSPEEIFFRAFRNAEFDICELSLSSHTVRTSNGESAYVGIPAFLSRAFRHTSIYIRKSAGIAAPADLKGKRIGVPEYQLSACVWARAILEDDYGVRPQDCIWVRGGLETPGRIEKIKVSLPEGIRLDNAPDGRTLSQMLLAGEIDAIVTPRSPSCFDEGHPDIDWLFEDPAAVAEDYFRRTKIFPIMHVLGLRRTIAESHPWLPATLLKAFTRSKEFAEKALSDTSATKVTMPFVEEQLRRARLLAGSNCWSYGVPGNRDTLDYFLESHHRQGLSQRRVGVDELFHPATLEAFSV